MQSSVIRPNPKLDLMVERVVNVPKELVWAAWTTPDHIKKWFTPAPWTTSECEMDVRPGGIFRTVMRSPEGESFESIGCFLELVPSEKLIWTNALRPGFRPPAETATSPADFPFTAVITLASEGENTRYAATVIHADEESRQKHESMGFYDGWGKALDQLVALVKDIRSTK
jgi:uncharacterized protein YndB with AHSA1/START domain